MKRPLLLTTALLASGLLLTGCTATGASLASSESATSGTSTETTSATTTSDYDLAPDAVMAENDDYTTVNTDEWSEADAVDVTLSGSSASSSSSSVKSSGGTVTISSAGVYRLSGSLSGQLVVEAPDDALVVLLLDGADITNDSGAAIWVKSADDVALHLATGSSNSVSDASSYADDAEADAAIFADTDLTISGDGALTVKANGNDGIVSTDDLVVLSGALTVNALDDALRGKDSLVVEGGELTLSSESGDGMKSNGNDGDDEIDWTRGYIYVSGGSIDITAGDDGLQAFTDTVIAGGTLSISVADDGVKGEAVVSVGEVADISAPSLTITKSTEGLEAANVGISGGTLDITASDDGINASGNAELQALIAGETAAATQNREADTGERLEITAGSITINAGSDGLDSNGSITVSGGEVTITSAANGGDGPIDGNGEVSVADGVVTANGAAYDPSTSGGMSGGPGGGGQGGAPQGGGPGRS